MLSAAFFVASLIHVPIGPSNAHLILNGLVGILLGWAAFPAILVALILHGVFFQFGGITSLGVNTIIMALPAVLCYLVFGKLIHKSSRTATAAAFACGFLSVLISGVIVGLSLIFTEENFLKVSGIIIAAHIPVMLIEGIITAACVAFLRKVRPEMLPGYHG
jgi:cobalt/nickel transport system permease protein